LAACVFGVNAAEAQVELERRPLKLTIEAFANATSACDHGGDSAAGSEGCGARLDGAFRLVGLAKGTSGWAAGPRIILQSSPEDEIELGERSLLFLTPWGRFEVGRRQGLPDVLVGYAPNTFIFTSAEFGPATGPGLDPDGRLPTAFLEPAMAGEINSLSTLGFAASYFLDQSFKLIYVPPRKAGFQGGFSFAPDMDERTGPFKQLLQTGLTYECYTPENVFRLGATYTIARSGARGGDSSSLTDLHSASFGATAVLSDRLILGGSLSYNGASGLPRFGRALDRSRALGYAASLNYNVGPWTVGGYFQSAQAEGDVARVGDDRLRVIELGASYRVNPRIRIYGSGYFYRFRDEGAESREGLFQGAVFLLGTRVTL
jgi:hypothetical protein